MADITADAPIRTLGQVYQEDFYIDTAAARTIYRGQPIIVDQSVDATGNVVQFVDSVVVDPADVFMGIAIAGASVVSGGPETTRVYCYVGPTIVGFKSAVFTDGADNGKTVYMSDSGTLSVTAADNPMLGKLHCVREGYAFVELSSPTICTGA